MRIKPPVTKALTRHVSRSRKEFREYVESRRSLDASQQETQITVRMRQIEEKLKRCQSLKEMKMR